MRERYRRRETKRERESERQREAERKRDRERELLTFVALNEPVQISKTPKNRVSINLFVFSDNPEVRK